MATSISTAIANSSTVLPWTEAEGASEWSYPLDVNASWLRSPTWYSELDTSLTYGVQSTHHLEIRGIHGNGTILDRIGHESMSSSGISSSNPQRSGLWSQVM